MNLHGGDIYSQTIEYDFSVNLNPLDCSSVHEAIVKEGAKYITRYPDPFQNEFREAVAKAEGVRKEEVWGGNGASELLSGVAAMLHPHKVLLAEPCFSGYRHVFARIPSCIIESYYLNEKSGFSMDEGFTEQLEKLCKEGLDAVVIANPNNPSGRCIDKETEDIIFRICKTYGTKLIADECFLQLAGGAVSLANRINEYDGLFVINAFTKLFALPGIRAGYISSAKENIDRLPDYLPEWNLSAFASASGRICGEQLSNTDFLRESCELIEKERFFLTERLQELGFTVFPSDTCFLLLKTKDVDLKQKLIAKGILIRDCADFGGLEKGFYRIAVKTRDENEVLLRALREIRG